MAAMKNEPSQSDIFAYEHPFVTTDVVALSVGAGQQDNYRKLPEKHLEVLLVQRDAEPFAGQWALPGGFIHPGQTAREAALSKLQEKTGVPEVYLEQLFTFTEPDRDPRGWVVSSAHLALIEKGSVVQNEGSQRSCWFAAELGLVHESTDHYPEGRVEHKVYELRLSLQEQGEKDQGQPGETSDAALPGQAVITARVEHVITTTRTLRADEFAILDDGGLAFDHAKQIVYAILRLRNKIEYTDLALNLMPELFTLTDLQKVYEVILGRELLKAGFRRTVKDLVVETDEQTSSAGHRPSKLYRRNWNISLS